MTLIKTSLLSSISAIIKILTGFVTVKVISVYLGPSGLALVAQVNNFISMISSISSLGIGNGIVKYTAEFKEDENEKRKIWSNALKLSLIVTGIVSLMTIMFSKHLSFKLLGSSEYSYVFILLSISLFLFILNGIFASILNGLGEIKTLTLLNIIGSFISFVVSLFLVMTFKLHGAVVALIISQSIGFFVTFYFIIKKEWFKISMFFGSFDKKTVLNLLKFSAMMLTASTVNMGALIFLRDYIGDNLGWNEAGYWQGVWRISETYLMLITTTLSIYYLPKLSSIKDKKELIKEILHGYKILMPIVISLAVMIYVFRDIIIKIIFSPEFEPMSELFLFQLLGDVFKIASWLLGFIMVAKAMTKTFILTEIVFVVSFIGLSLFFLNIYGLKGITIAFMINYFLYLITLIVVFYSYFYKI